MGLDEVETIAYAPLAGTNRVVPVDLMKKRAIAS